MDKIKLNFTFDKTDFIKENTIRWKIHWKKYNRQLIIYWILSIFIYSLGILLTILNEPSELLVFIGIGFLVTAFLMTFNMIYSWKKTSKKIKLSAEKYEEINMNCVYELSEDSVKYWDQEKHLSFKWSIFSHYMFYKDYVVLVLNDSLINSYLFDKKSSGIENYDKILNLAKSKLPYKEFK